MMGNEIFHLASVSLGLTALLVVPFIPCAVVINRRAPWPEIILTSLVLGLCIQAITGLLWSHLVGSQPYGELILFATIWGVLSYWSIRHRRKTRQDLIYVVEDATPRYFLLPVILMLAFAVRSMHPLEAAYLGQSDAYTHLDYLRSIVENGHLFNPSYPPGYHWILALPVLVFSIEPYWIARFAGGFFGTGLVLGIFVMMERMFNRRIAYFSAFTVACFPPMTLLIKTGVGSFANQFGLFLLPATFFFYYCFVTDQGRWFRFAGLTMLSLAGMAAAVPMMLLHVIVIFAVHRLLDLRRLSLRWVSTTAVICLVVSIPAGLVLFHMSSLGPGQRIQTANILVEYNVKKEQPVHRSETIEESTGSQVVRRLKSSPYYGLAVDYFSLKRLGFGNVALNVLGGVLGLLFFGFSLYGLIHGKTNFLILGLWGGVTVVQAASGFLQFSSYQREGWSLLIATCCLSGVIADWLLEKIPGHVFPRLVMAIVMGMAVLWAFMHPPRHEPISSTAEDQIVRSARFLGLLPDEKDEICRQKTGGGCEIVDLLQPDLPLTLITRRFTGWRNQGEITPNVLQRKTSMQVKVVGKSAPADLFACKGQYVALIDTKAELSQRQIASAFAMVTPSMVRATLRQQERLYAANKTIMEAIDLLSQEHWMVNEVVLAENLSATVIVPKSACVE